MCSPLLPEGLSSEILEMLIRVNQVRPSTEGTVAVLEAAPKHLSPLTVSTVRLLVIPPPPARRKTDSSTDFPFNCSIMPSCGFLTHEVGCYIPPQMRGLPCKDGDVEGKEKGKGESYEHPPMYQGQGWLWVVGFSPYNNLNCEGTQVMVWNHLHSAKLSTLLQNIFHTTSSTRWYVKKKKIIII